MQIRKIKPIELFLFIYLCYTYFYQLIDIFGGAPLSYGSLVLPILACLLFYFFKSNGLVSKSGLRFFTGWWVLAGIVLLHNASFDHGIYFDSIRLVAVIVLTFVLSQQTYWEDSAIKIMAALGMVHVAATILFFLSNDLFSSTVLNLFEFPPVGSNNGLEGFHSGLSDHYSLNGTYCGVTTIILGSQLITNLATKSKVKIPMIVLFVASFVALLLTSKRAHLLFSVIALVGIYYVVNPEKRENKIFKLILLALVALLGVAILIESGSPLATTFTRFMQSSGEDISNGRFIMWLLAIEEFVNNPIVGLGWQGYRYSYAENLFVAGNYAGGEDLEGFKYLDTHNVYLQVLCETGIIGFVFFLMAIILPLLTALRLVRIYLNDHNVVLIRQLAFSIGIQIFMLVYCFTGCCINDITFLIYMMAITTVASINFLDHKRNVYAK